MAYTFHRTLVRVTGKQRGGIWLCVPGWNSTVSVLRPISSIPATLASVGRRFFAYVNLGTDNPAHLEFLDIEIPNLKKEAHDKKT